MDINDYKDLEEDNYNTDIYFAALPENEIGPALKVRIDNYNNYVQQVGIYDLWSNSYQKYFASSINAGSLMKAGEQGEYDIYKQNDYRNLLQYILTLTTKQRPAFNCISINSDMKSMAQAQLGNSLLDYYIREKKMADFLKMVAEYCLVLGEGFFECVWNTSIGEKLPAANPQNQSNEPPFTQPLKFKGDVEFNAYTPMNIIRDFYGNSSNDAQNWVIVRQLVNKWDLAAKYPEKRKDIISSSIDINSWLNWNSWNSAKYNMQDCDLIPLYKFYHKPTEALPEGRMTLFINDETILLDTTLPYKEIPIYRLAGSEYIGTIFGWSVAYDILNCQEALDNLNSIIMTNNMTFGVQNIAVPAGSNIVPSQLVKGLNLISFDPKIGVPQAINFTSTPVETYNYRQEVIQTMETLSGINSVTRGEPQASLKSGTALALIESRSIEFNSGFQETYTKCAESVATAIINLLRTFGSVQRSASIVGKAKRSLMVYFTGDDLGQINRVQVEPANPLSKTVAGKLQLAEDLIKNKMISTPEEYLQVLSSGTIEPLINGPTAELNLIQSENEELATGNLENKVVASIFDNHKLHIQEHKTIAASTESRMDGQVMQALSKHIQEHMDLYRNADPFLLQITGQELPPPANPTAQASPVPVLDNQNPVNKKADEVQAPQPVKPPEPLLAEQQVNEQVYDDINADIG